MLVLCPAYLLTSLIDQKVRPLYQQPGSRSTSGERSPAQRSLSHTHDTLKALPTGSRYGSPSPERFLESLPTNTATARGRPRRSLQVGKMSKFAQSEALRLIREMRRNKAARGLYIRPDQKPWKPPVARMLG